MNISTAEPTGLITYMNYRNTATDRLANNLRCTCVGSLEGTNRKLHDVKALTSALFTEGSWSKVHSPV